MTADLTSRLEALEWERCTNYIRTIPGDFIVVSADSNWATDDAVLDGIVARHNATLKAPPSAIRENWPTQEELSAAQWIVTQVHRRAVWDQGDLDRLFTALHAVNRCGNTYAATNAPPPEVEAKTDERIEYGFCTLCAKVPSDGFYTSCMVNDGADMRGDNTKPSGWSCDGNGHLIRWKRLDMNRGGKS